MFSMKCMLGRMYTVPVQYSVVPPSCGCIGSGSVNKFLPILSKYNNLSRCTMYTLIVHRVQGFYQMFTIPCTCCSIVHKSVSTRPDSDIFASMIS